MKRRAFGLRRLSTVFPKEFVVNMFGEAVTEKSGRMGERECVLGCVQVQKLILIARGLERGSCSLAYLYLRPPILNSANNDKGHAPLLNFFMVASVEFYILSYNR